MPQLQLRTGLEIELVAPRGSSRRTLAEELARRYGGVIAPVWHHDSEPSLVAGLGRFLHLTQGFEVRGARGELICTVVDDITLLADLDPHAQPVPGWYRVLTDDSRLLHLLAGQLDPGADLHECLVPAAALWHGTVQQHGHVFKLDDVSGATIAMAAPQGGERERPCEVITPPLSADHEPFVESLLAPARDLGFAVPVEAAVHLHYDGSLFRSPPTLSNVVRLFGWWRPALHELLETNPACRRLAALPAPLLAAVEGDPTVEQMRDAARAGGLTKFYDVNLTQLFLDEPVRDTLEVRILPGAIHTADIVRRAALVEQLLRRCLDPQPLPTPSAQGGAGVDELVRLTAGPPVTSAAPAPTQVR